MKKRILMVTLFIITAVIAAASAYADVLLSAYMGDSQAASPGDKDVQIELFVLNSGSEPFSFSDAKINFGDSSGISNIRLTPAGGTVEPDTPFRMVLQVNLSNSVSSGIRAFNIIFDDEAVAPPVGPLYLFIADENTQITQPEIPGEPRTYRAAADFTHTLGAANGFSPGKTNTVTFYVLNRGDTPIRNAVMTVELPDGMAVYNASTTSFIGTVSIGQRAGRSFSVMVYDDTEGGRAYPVTVKITGTDRAGSAVNLESTFYIPVTGTGAGAVRDIVIENVSIPDEVAADEDFTLAFSVRNTGPSAVSNIKAYVEMPEGIINKTNAAFVIDSIGPSETQAFSVILSARNSSNSSYPIKIAVEPLSGGGTGDVIRYARVFANSGGDTAKTPQLMVDQYSYGGSSVMAGSDFYLNLGLLNTSGKSLSNIKVTIVSDDGTFVPVDSSNSFFIDRIEGGGHYAKSVRLSAKPSAEQKTTAITVRMAYEDQGGETYNADDTISIPVVQAMRLSVDEIVPPYECYAGMAGSSTLQFYNMGKTTLYNLMINAEGDFDVMESNRYFVGNMEGGRSDSYSFVFVPREVGPMEGRVIFTYENEDGMEYVYEAPFVFQAMEMPVWDEYYPEETQQSRAPWAIIIFGIVIVLAVAGVIVFRKVRKAKANKRLEIEDEQF